MVGPVPNSDRELGPWLEAGPAAAGAAAAGGPVSNSGREPGAATVVGPVSNSGREPGAERSNFLPLGSRPLGS